MDGINMISQKSRLLVSVSTLILLLALCTLVYNQNALLNLFDGKVTQIVQSMVGTPQMNYHGNIFNDLMTFLATYGDATPLVCLTIIIAIVLIIQHYPLLAFWFLGVVASGGILGVILKFALHRTRPIGHLMIDDGFSFPSGHAVGSTLVLLTIIMIIAPLISNHLLKISVQSICVLIWIGILYSRLYFSAHHISDLVAGVLLGIFWIIFSKLIYDNLINWIKKIYKKA